MKKYVCPICGYHGLKDNPRSSNTGGGSYEICPCCGFQFGVSDDDEGWTYDTWRSDWVKKGMKWWSKTKNPPEGWNPTEQISKI